jgi:hypothetical protein
VIRLSRHPDLDAHFAGTSSTGSDQKLFRHVKTCARCRDEYRALSMLEALEPDGSARALERMRRGLFEPTLTRRLEPTMARQEAKPRRVLFGGGFAVAFAALALVVSLGRARHPFHGQGDDFAARGSIPGVEAPLPSLAIYRVPRDAANPTKLSTADIQRAGGVVHADESLAFSYTSPASLGACCVMIFARDAAGRVYWFWPAWDDASADPASLPITASDAPVELTQAVRHELAPGPLTIVGLFTPKPLHVKEVEAAVANGLPGLQAFPGHVWTETLEVAR